MKRPPVRLQLSAAEILERQPRTSHKPEKRTNVSTRPGGKTKHKIQKYKKKTTTTKNKVNEIHAWLVTAIRQIQQL